ncbi:mCG1036475 [Mus musculus]|nr:mCG1036475 [Mus musculus]
MMTQVSATLVPGDLTSLLTSMGSSHTCICDIYAGRTLRHIQHPTQENRMEYIASLVVENTMAIHSEVVFQTHPSLLPASSVLANGVCCCC